MIEQAHPDQDPQPYTATAEYAALVDAPLIPDGEHMAPTEPTLETEESTHELRAAQAKWLERRGLLEDTPRLTMKIRELGLLRSVRADAGGDTALPLIDKTKRDFGIPPDAHYISVDVAPDTADQPHATKIVAVQTEHFGTEVDEGWLESRGIKLESLPHVSVNEQELGLLGIIGIDDDNTASRVAHARSLYRGLKDPQDPQNDQYAPRYVLIDAQPDDPSLPRESLIMAVDEERFGKIINPEEDKAYLEHGPNPDDPQGPESGGTYVIRDIGHELSDSRYDLGVLAANLMSSKTENPLSGKFWFRAGGVTMVGLDGVERTQDKAYVWDNGRGLASAVELTLNCPSDYRSVCAVVGERRDPGNGKNGMAQIENPTVVVSIEGANLRYLQEVYKNLYHEPNFVLTKQQREERDEIFNTYLARLTAEAAENNSKPQGEKSSRVAEESGPKYRARET